MSPCILFLLGLFQAVDAPPDTTRPSSLAIFTFRGKALEPPASEAFSDSLALRLGSQGGWQVVDRRELKVHAGPGQGRYDQCDELSCVISHGKRFGAVTAIVGWMEVDEGIRIRARAIDVHSGVILKQAERKSVLSSSLAMSTLLDSLSADFAWQGRTFGSPPEEEPSRSRRIDSLRHERQRRVRAGTISSGLAMAGLLVAGTIQMKHENDCGTSVGEGGTLASPQGCEDPSRAPQILAVASAGFALYGIMQFVGLARLDDEIAKLSSAGKQVIPRIQLDPLGSRFALGWDTRF